MVSRVVSFTSSQKIFFLLLYFVLLCAFANFPFLYLSVEWKEVKVLTSQARHRRDTPRETPTADSLVVAMSTKELRLYNQIPTKISLETSDGTATSTFGEADNVVYFTREQFAAGLHLPVPSPGKQFLHFTRAPPARIHSNAFQILMGCSVLYSLYQLDILMVEICFVYTLKLRNGGHLSMSAHSPRL